MITDYDLSVIIEPLQTWFSQNARVLPWRSDPTPYHVWISEIMLQQTRVEAVKPYYTRFLENLPDPAALAACTEDRYLKLWEGLGYYSRVRNLHAAAVQIMEDYGGVIPGDSEKLRKLKGIGSYTAGAIASIAFHQPVPAVDGNVLRVLSRITGDDSDIALPGTKAQVEAVLGDLMQKQSRIDPGRFNQALMELGALVCLPNGQPHCRVCPLGDVCEARLNGRTEELPVKKKAKARRIEQRTILILRDGDTAAIHKRPDKGLLAGLYELPSLPGHKSEQEVLSYVKSIGFSPLRIRPLDKARHIFSHVEWDMIGYRLLIEESALATDEQRQRAEKENLLFVNAAELKERYAIPSAFSAYTEYIPTDSYRKSR